MKILLVIDSLGSGGAQRLFISIANELSALHQVTVFLYNDNSGFFRHELSSKIPVYGIKQGLKRGFRPAVVRAVRRQIQDVDIVISFLPSANIYCALARLLSRRVLHVACEFSVTNEGEGKVRRLMANLVNYFSDHVICNSFAQTDYVRSRRWFGNGVSTIWSGSVGGPFKLRPARDARSMSLLIVGRVAYPKNGVRLLKALQIFQERNGFLPEVKWAGRDEFDVRSRRMKLEMLAFLERHPEVNERFFFIGEVSETALLYAAADALILPSIYEGVPVVICEAFLAGCPVVASNISDNERILGANGERGILCDPLSPADICLAIESLVFMSPLHIERMTRNASDFAEERFSVSKMVDGYLRVIDFLTSKGMRQEL